MSKLIVAIAQIKPIWLNKKEITQQIIQSIKDASKKGSDILTFSEGLLPGYPFWLSFTQASKFESQVQKELFAFYHNQSVDIKNGDLKSICDAARDYKVAVYLGIIEKDANRGYSLYASFVYINKLGEIKSVHRKLVPTYEERLVWSIGDGNGLQVHKLGDFNLGGLNCWENWMPLVRSSLYAQGEDVHFACWPGSKEITENITRFIAKESRSYVVSSSIYLTKNDIPKDIPHSDLIVDNAPEILANGGSCIANPDGTWLIEPITNKTELLIAEIDKNKIAEERHNFDPSGHYSRPDVTKLIVNRERQEIVETINFNEPL